MPDVVTLSIDRSPQIALAAASDVKGWVLQPTVLAGTAPKPGAAQGPIPSPADHLLPPELRSRVFPQGAWSALVGAPPAGTSNMDIGMSGRYAMPLLFNPLYATLYDLYLARNAVEIERTASTFLREHPIVPFDRLDPTTQKLFRFFNQHGGNATITDYRALYSSFDYNAVLGYLSNAAAATDLFKSQVLAAHVLGTLGSQNYNLVQFLPSILLFSGIAPYFLTQPTDYQDRPTEPGLWLPVKLLGAVWNMQCYLPAWTFEIDPCAWSKPASDINNNPLQSKLTALDAYATKVARKQAALAVTGRGGDASNLLADIPECNPQASDPDCDCCPENILCLPPDPCCTDINYYVTDLLVLREQTTCYKPSDIAYIENVSPGEFRNRKYSLTKTIEEFTEEETKVSKTQENDLQVTDRFDLKTEIEKNLSAKLDVTAQVTGPTYKVTTAAGLSMSTAQTEARETFKEAVNKAVSTLQVDTRKTQSLRVRTENVESNEHSYLNDTTVPFVSKYFWVTQVKKGQVFSYGLHGTVELLIPSPAMLYEHLEKVKSERGFGLKKPKHPCIAPKDIKKEDYDLFVVKYNLRGLEKPPKQPLPKWVMMHFYGAPDTTSEITGFEAKPITIADNYAVTRFEFVAIPHMPEEKDSASSGIHVRFGGGEINYLANQNDAHSSVSGADVNERSDGIFSVGILNLDSYNFDIRYLLKPDPVDISDWQLAVYKAIVDKYEAELRTYEEALAEYNRQKEDSKLGRDPFVAKEIMTTEIKRAAIYMMCDEFERDGIINMRSEPCGYPEINRRAAGDKTKGWYFWDRAFDWDLMSFRFFDYFRNPVCSWPDKFDPADPNFLFNAFRRAGYARVQIPVSAGMDQDVLWYIKTHQKWGPGGHIPMGPGDDRWISVVEEIKHSYKCYQNDREGNIFPIADEADPLKGTMEVRLKDTDLYWNVFTSSVDNHAIDLDKEREIFIDGIGYKIVNISPGHSPPYDPAGVSDWIILLDRVFESKTEGVYKHAVGAKYVGAPFFFELPTNLVWIGDYDNKCLPCYPLKACTS
jgi:hypothetical protein